MPANIRETKIGFGYRKQTDLATPNAAGDIWSLTKTNAALTNVTLNTENDAAELGKGARVRYANVQMLELGFKNNLRLDSGFYPGSGTQDGAAIRGRLEFGDREASLKFVARFEHGSTELAKLRSQTTGAAVISLQGDLISGSDYHSLEVTFHKVAFRTAVVGDTDGIVTVEVECHPLWDAVNGLLTAVAKCSQDNIG